MGIPVEVMRLGQNFMDHMEDYPEQSDELLDHMQRSFEQFKAGTRDKSIEGSYRPTTKDGEFTMNTVVTLKDQHGAGIKFEKDALFKTLAEAGIHVTDQAFPPIPGEARVVVQQVKEAPLVLKSEETAQRRQSRLNDLVEFDIVHQAKKILWKCVEVLGMSIVIGGCILAGVWIANMIWRGPQDGPMPALS